VINLQVLVASRLDVQIEMRVLDNFFTRLREVYG
jgi:hypothetical protein